MMDTPDESPVDDSLIIDVIGPCGCCTYTGVASSEFLEAFTENLPEVGKQKLLRIHGVTVPGFCSVAAGTSTNHDTQRRSAARCGDGSNAERDCDTVHGKRSDR